MGNHLNIPFRLATYQPAHSYKVAGDGTIDDGSTEHVVFINENGTDPPVIGQHTHKSIPVVRYLAPNAAVAATRAPLLYSHGNATDIALCADVCRQLAHDLGRDVYSYDYPGYGVNSGKVSEQAFYDTTVAVLQYITSHKLQLQVNQPAPVVFGRSLGTAMSVYAAVASPPPSCLVKVQAPPISGMILVSPFKSIVTTQLPRYIGVPSMLDSMPTASRLKRCTVRTMIIHGMDDQVVPFYHGETLAKCACVESFVGVKGAGHNSILEMTDAWVGAVRGFLEKRCDAALPPPKKY